ncbi:MAG TPA: tetratricopeptide repeat protein [Planctomycetota bacterium]|nr:tetratricopeptide repeat protein [Planctomycetota bacterium]
MAQTDQTRLLAEAKEHLRAGKLDLAERAFRDALAADPKDAGALVGLAQVFTLQGRKPEAIQVIADAAALHAEAGRLDKAIEVYRRVMKLDPQRTDVQERLATILWDSGKHEEALAELRAAGATYTARGSVPDRLRVLARCVEYAPEAERSKIRVEYAETLQKAGQTKEALIEYRDEARLLEAIGTLEIIGNRGSMHGGAAYRLLVEILERVVALDPADVSARLRLGRYQLAGRPARAISTLLSVLAVERRNVNALKLLDHAFLAVGQFDRAALTFDEIRTVDPVAFVGDPNLRDDASQIAPVLAEADVLLSEGRLDQAREWVRALVSRKPGSIPARLKLQDLYVRTGNIDAAIAEISAAVALALEAGDKPHARVVLQVGLKLAPFHPGLRESCVRVAENLDVT